MTVLAVVAPCVATTSPPPVAPVIERAWAMPSPDTLSIKPILSLVERYAAVASCIVDPFARNCRIAHYTNDINPQTRATYHMDALSFLTLLRAQHVSADLVIFDPPYSSRQVKECYDSIGRPLSARESTNFYQDLRDAISDLVGDGGIVISMGWNSIGMGMSRGFALVEVLMVCHGGVHNDTIVTVERKTGRITPPFVRPRPVALAHPSFFDLDFHSPV